MRPRNGPVLRGLESALLSLWLLLAAAPSLAVEPSTDGAFTLHSINTLASAGALQPRAHLQYAASSATFDVDRPPLGGLIGDEDTSEFSGTISACTQTNLPNYDGDEPPCSPIEIGDTRPPLLPDATIDGPVGDGQHVQAFVSIGGPTWVPLFRGIPVGGDVLAFVSNIVGRELTWDDIDFANSVIPTESSAVIKSDYGQRLIAGNPGSLFTMDLRFNFDFNGDGVVTSQDHFERDYLTAFIVVSPTVVLYHTHDGATREGSAPTVDLSQIPKVTIHHNSVIPCATNPDHCGDPPANPEEDTRTIWIEDGIISAREVEGLIVLEYADQENPSSIDDLLGFEVVQIKRDVPDSAYDEDIGSRLKPAMDEVGKIAFVREGGTGATPQLIYQHAVEGSPQEGQVWAIRDNLQPSSMRVVWMRPGLEAPGLEGIEWPYEYREYTTKWPDTTEEAKYQLYVRAPESPDALGPEVQIPSELNPSLEYEDHANPNHHSRLDPNTFYTDGPGWSLLKFETGPTPGQDWVGFEVVRSVSHQDGSIFNLGEVSRDIGSEITDSYHEGPNPGYIHTAGTSLRYAPEVYQDTGQIFGVNEDTPPLEVWWMNLSRTVDPEGSTYPAWPDVRFQWPSKVSRYRSQWPATPKKIIIARQNGTGALDPSLYGADWSIYGADGSKANLELPGFNPNDEHALTRQYNTGRAAFALRDDLGTPATSEPYVLLQYREQPLEERWAFEIYQVLREEGPYVLRDWVGMTDPYEGKAGVLIQPPFPLSTLPMYCEETETEGVSGPYFKDRTGRHWMRAAGADGGSAEITMRYYYPAQPSFFFSGGEPPPLGSCVPWLDDGSGVPADVTYTVTWPANVPTMRVGQTVFEPQAGLPAIDGPCSVDIVYQQSVANGDGPSATLVDPVQAREVSLTAVPGEIITEEVGQVMLFPQLTLALGLRVSFDHHNEKLRFQGHRVMPVTGFDYALLNVMSERERDELLSLSTDEAWSTAVETLYQKTREPVVISDSGTDVYDGYDLHLMTVATSDDLLNNGRSLVVVALVDTDLHIRIFDADGEKVVDKAENKLVKGETLNALKSELDPFPDESSLSQEKKREILRNAALLAVLTVYDKLALTSGFAEGMGYVTLVMQNTDERCGESPVSLEIVRVIPELEPGGLAVYTPSCPFDETLTLRHQGDFGGRTEAYEFQWRYVADLDGSTPPPPIAGSDPDWTAFTPVPADGLGAVDATIRGPGLLTLGDNWFVSRYRTTEQGLPWSHGGGDEDGWSDWTTPPQLAQGWIKRVMGDINPFDQRASGGGIEGAEKSFFSYGESEINTLVNMIKQAGPRWEGSVPLGCTDIDDFGLLEIYETVMNRGIDFSIDGLPAVNYPPANNALLLVASRIADLYTLLGNEAFADASDPTIAFGTDDGQFGAEASSIHPFQNLTSSLLEEELALLRGRDDAVSPGVQVAPFYNRLIWNFTNDATGGEVAYALNYNIRDELGNVDGAIDEADAKMLYPQGHGDAWGHYLTALKAYYRLLRHPNYTWNPRAEGVLVGGVPVTVDYLDERKFAQAAAAKARAGSELVNLIYREAYVEEPTGQWQGYADSDPTRAWGLAEWASRAGQGTYFDWVVANAILPDQDPDETHTGIQKIDRGTVLELPEVASRFQEIQAQLDTADLGLNPLGLATNVIPFDISPAEIDAGKTHFEQIYDRAVTAMNNAIAVFNHANNSTQLLRRQADTLADFEQTVGDREVDFTNRLIETFGYPYEDDIGPGQTYPSSYQGPDLYHYTYVDATEVLGVDVSPTTELTLEFQDLEVQPDGSLVQTTQEVIFHISTSADRFGLVKPGSWTGERRAPGEIQLARSDLLQARARFEQSLLEYDLLVTQIEDQAGLLAAQHDLNDQEIQVLNQQLGQQQTLNDRIASSRAKQLDFRKKARVATLMGNALAEMLPRAIGFSNDTTSAIRGAIRLGFTVRSEVWNQNADGEALAELGHQQTLGELQAANQITLTSARNEFAIVQALKALEQAVRREASLRINLYTAQEALNQSAGRYLATLTRGQRLLEDRNRFRRQTAADVQSRRYKDMAFRIFRNDALQKYRAQFDLAARYVYLAAKAYDFETTLLSSDSQAGGRFLADLVRKRLIGTIQGGLPQTGQGLADPMARMSQNFSVLKGQLGFTNPQSETNRFSLRSELFRIGSGPADGEVWRETLRRHVVPNLLDLPEFQRSARFEPGLDIEPAIVIPFSTEVHLGQNFFGWPAGGGDNAYDASHFATKVRSVGVWFSNYNNLSLVNTPRVYLVPVGSDILRSPTVSGITRQFKIQDQRLPAPFPIGDSNDQCMVCSDNPDWIPRVDTLTDFAAIRRYSSFRAYHDSGQFDVGEVQRTDSRAIGRSVWNTRWLLVIPAGTLLSDRDEGIRRFIDGQLGDGNGVSDIKIFFETYSISGN